MLNYRSSLIWKIAWSYHNFQKRISAQNEFMHTLSLQQIFSFAWTMKFIGIWNFCLLILRMLMIRSKRLAILSFAQQNHSFLFVILGTTVGKWNARTKILSQCSKTWNDYSDDHLYFHGNTWLYELHGRLSRKHHVKSARNSVCIIQVLTICNMRNCILIYHAA